MAAASQITCTLDKYADLLDQAGIVVRRPGVQVEAGIEVTYATDDSRAARPGTLFVCKGAAFKREYLLQAIEAGAVAYVSEADYGASAPIVPATVASNEADSCGGAPAALAGVAGGEAGSREDISVPTDMASSKAGPCGDALAAPTGAAGSEAGPGEGARSAPAAAVLSQAPCILVTDIRAALGLLADAAYDHPSGRVKVCAFTGTKGKTTSAYYLRSMLAAHAEATGTHAPALLTGVEYDDGIECGESLLTTPESFELERRLANAASAGCEHVVMEASSQALKYQRTRGVEFAVGAFTNFGEDHISPIEHPTLEDYLESKLMLFDRCRVAAVNLDMDVADRALAAARASKTVERVLTYSIERTDADVAVLAFERGERGIRARVRTPRFTRMLMVPSPAVFNLSNALGAIACAEALGVAPEAIERGLAEARVPGRMELYPSASGRIMGVVDYAHNGMSLETLLRDLRASYPGREIAVVFGATGGKGVDRRETMGAAAGRLADRIVITEDDPGPEDPAVICEAIARAVSAQGHANWRVELDRSAAIERAVRETAGPAVVIVTGKGNDPFMLRRGVREPYEPDGVQLQRALDAWEAAR